MSVEPSYLYLDNRFMQFAHGRCLAVELESLGAPSSTPRRVAWPRGFNYMHAAARPGGNRPPEYDAIAALGGDTPHYGYPLRNVGEISFQIKKHADGDSFGDVSQLQALRECYPGATYLHLTRAYEVAAWHTGSFESFIRVKNAAPGRSTRPRIRTWINAGITPAELQESRLISGETGFLAECLMQITERVEGYDDSRTGRFHPYKELQQRNPNMRALPELPYQRHRTLYEERLVQASFAQACVCLQTTRSVRTGIQHCLAGRRVGCFRDIGSEPRWRWTTGRVHSDIRRDVWQSAAD